MSTLSKQSNGNSKWKPEIIDDVKHWLSSLRPAPPNEDPLTWHERHQRKIEAAQKENDALLERFRQYGKEH